MSVTKNLKEFHKQNKCHFPTACICRIINIQSNRKDLQTQLFIELLELLVSSFVLHFSFVTNVSA